MANFLKTFMFIVYFTKNICLRFIKLFITPRIIFLIMTHVLGSNILSDIFIRLNYHTMVNSAPYVCKKWCKAFKDVRVYRQIDNHFIQFRKASFIFESR